MVVTLNVLDLCRGNHYKQASMYQCVLRSWSCKWNASREVSIRLVQRIAAVFVTAVPTGADGEGIPVIVKVMVRVVLYGKSNEFPVTVECPSSGCAANRFQGCIGDEACRIHDVNAGGPSGNRGVQY